MATYDSLLASYGPVAWWKLADAVGSATAADSSGNGYTGTVNGTVTFGQTGPITGTPADTAALFDGSTGYIDTGAPGALNITGAFSLVAWIKTTHASNQIIMGRVYTTSYYLNTTNGKLSFWCDGTNLNSLIATLDDGNWHMVVATMDSTGNAVLYVDGSPNESGTMSLPTSTTDHLYIGLAPGVGYYFNGDIGESAIFNTALTSTQIANLYAARLILISIYEIQQSLSILAGNPGPVYYEAQQAANIWAGTSGLELQAALNCKYRGVTTIQALVGGGYQIYDTPLVANLLAGTTGKEAQDALSNLAGGGHT